MASILGAVWEFLFGKSEPVEPDFDAKLEEEMLDEEDDDDDEEDLAI